MTLCASTGCRDRGPLYRLLVEAISGSDRPTPGPPVALQFTVQPSSTVAGDPISPGVQVTTVDAHGRRAPHPSFPVSVSLVGPGGAILSGTRTVITASGLATYSDLSVDRPGIFRIEASAAGMAPATSEVFSVLRASPSRLSFSRAPTLVAPAATISPPVEVSILDGAGNLVRGATLDVTVALGSNGGGSALSGTCTVTSVDGVATFPDLAIDRPGSGYTLVASAPGLMGAETAPFDAVVPGLPTRLAFVTQPTEVRVGKTMSPFQVALLDAFGNVASSASDPVSIWLPAWPSRAILGTRTVAAVAGVATFTDLSINGWPGTVVLTATAQGLAAVESQPFPLVGLNLRFQVQPTAVTAGDAFLPTVEVAVVDTLGRVATDVSGVVTLELGRNPEGAGLAGTSSVPCVAGVARFGDLHVDVAGTRYIIIANMPGFVWAGSAYFDVVPGQAIQLAFTVQPSGSLPGAAISPAVHVAVQDRLGNRVRSSSNRVSLSIGAGPVGPSLGGTTSADASGGLASFLDLSLDTEGDPYTLVASSPGLAAATSAAFAVAAFRPPDVANVAVPPGPLSGRVPVSYEVRQPNGRRVMVRIEFDPDGSGTFYRATQAGTLPGEDGNLGLTSSPAGAAHVFLWDSARDVPRTSSPSVAIRVTASADGQWGSPDTLQGVSIDNTTVRAEWRLEAAEGFAPKDRARSLAISDLNADGKLDVIVGNTYADGVSYFRGLGNGRLAEFVTIPTGRWSQQAVPADFNRDGLQDLAIGGMYDLSVFLQDPASPGSFLPAGSVDDESGELAAGDLDGDGLPDIVSVFRTWSEIRLFMQDPGDVGRFLPPVVLRDGYVGPPVLVDVDLDGRVDILTIDLSSRRAAVRLQDPARRGAFLPPVTSVLGSVDPLYDFDAGDLNGDGRVDLVVTAYRSAIMFRQDPAVPASFVSWTSFPTMDSRGVRAADFDADGRLDLAIMERYETTVRFQDPAAPGTFLSPRRIPYVTVTSRLMDSGDIDGNGVEDLVLAEGDLAIVLAEPSLPAGFRCAPELPASVLSIAGLAEGDIDGDGFTDLLLAPRVGQTLQALLQDPAAPGSFGAVNVSVLPPSLEPVYWAAASLSDLDADGLGDIVLVRDVTPSTLPDYVAVLLQDPSSPGTFFPQMSLAAGFYLADVFGGPGIGDLNSDGARDIAVVDRDANVLSVLCQVPTALGTFQTAVGYPVGELPIDLSLGDVNGDGLMDAVVVNFTAGTVSILLQSGAGLGPAQNIATAPEPRGVAVGDLDGDGLQDLAVGTTERVALHFQQAGGAFAAYRELPATNRSFQDLAIQDMDGDGRADVVVACGYVNVYLQDAVVPGQFLAPRRFVGGSGSMAVEDIDRDGTTDVAAEVGSSVLLLRGR